MNRRRYLVASAAATFWLLVFGVVVHGFLLSQFWTSQNTPGLMRPEGGEVFWAMLLSMLLQGMALGWIYVLVQEGRGLRDGTRFGLLVAWFVGALYLLFYALQPWNLLSTAVSVIVDGLMYLGVGVVLSLIYTVGEP